MNQEERKTAIRRMRVLVAAACILMLLYGLRLIFLQLVNGEDFKSQATNTTDYKFTVTAARGDIVDSRGERIATSVTGYNVVLNKLLMGDEDLDGMLQKIVELLRANGENWNDTLLISQPDAAGNYTFTAEAGSTRDQKALAAMKDNLGLQQYATANDVMEKLVEDYDPCQLSAELAAHAGRHPLRDAAAGILQCEQLYHGGKRQRGHRGDHQGAQPLAAGCGDRGNEYPQL